MASPVLKISATEANRSFSKLLRRARAGESVVITDRGKDVAIISPAGLSPEDEEALKAEKARRDAEWAAYMAELRTRTPLNLGKFNRDWAYEDD